ncbi:MAG: S8 family serine peptidase [Weeksellaceae bacterium]
MKRVFLYGKLILSLLGIVQLTYGQNQADRTRIATTVNQLKLESIITNAEQQSKIQQREVKRFIKLGYPEFIESDDGTFSQLIGSNELGSPVYLQTMNQNVVNTTGANILHNGFDGFNLTGNDMTIGLWEPSSPRLLHEILRFSSTSSRITYATGQISGINSHATHIAGTLIGNQTNINSPNQQEVRGMAYEAVIKAYDWNLAAAEMASEAQNGLLVANTSFGYAPAPLDESEYGRYSLTSREWDAVMCAAPFLQIVKPAGNVRDDSPYIVPQVAIKSGFDLLESSGTSKNVLVVSAFDLTKDQPSEQSPVYDVSLVEVPYSSWGPTDDGRIKPDITAHGHKVYSSLQDTNSAYGLLSGTSMATAGVSGVITLLQQYYNEKFGHLLDPSEVPYLWSSTIRALIIHSADEVGDPGPDYKYGWGVINAVSAAEIIEKRGTGTIIREETLEDQSEFKLNVISNGYEPLVVTIAWTDPEGEVSPNNPPVVDDTTHKLVNDLDVKLVRLDSNGVPATVIDSNGDNLLLPWKRLEGITADISLLSARSTRGVNNVDNVEKIEIPIDYLPQDGGLFQIVVSHKGVLEEDCTSAGQNFSLIVSGVSFCEDSIVLYQHEDDVQTVNGEGLHVKADNITASNVLEPVPDPNTDDYLVEYEAASFIELVPQGNHGFTSEYGSDFLAHINCQTGMTEAFSSRELRSLKADELPDSNLKMTNALIVYPNPIISSFLNVQFELKEPSAVDIRLYDMQAKLVLTGGSKEFSSGLHKQVLDISTQPKGIYILKIIMPDGTHTRKIIKK